MHQGTEIPKTRRRYCWVGSHMEQGDSTEQSPEIQLGCMRGLGGSEQLFLLRHSEVSSCIIDNIIYGCIPKSFRATRRSLASLGHFAQNLR